MICVRNSHRFQPTSSDMTNRALDDVVVVRCKRPMKPWRIATRICLGSHSPVFLFIFRLKAEREEGVENSRPGRRRADADYAGETSECVTACTDNATRLSTPTLRMSFDTCAFTVLSSMPNGALISLLERPVTNIPKISFSRSVSGLRCKRGLP